MLKMKYLYYLTAFMALASCSEEPNKKEQATEKVSSITLDVKHIESADLFFLKKESGWLKSKSFDATETHFKLLGLAQLNKDLDTLVSVWSKEAKNKARVALKLTQPNPRIDKTIYVVDDPKSAYVIFKENFIIYYIEAEEGKLMCETYYLPDEVKPKSN